MTLYTCIIIDDELLAIEGLKSYIDLIPNLTLVNYYTNPVQALMEITAGNHIDLLFVDIGMSQIDGFNLAKQLKHKTNKLVFTADDIQHAYNAFEAGADDYLLKPYSITKFAFTILRLFPAQPSIPKTVITDNDYFFVKNKEEHLKMVKISYKDIIAVESKQNYVMIHTAAKNVLTYMSLIEISKTLYQYPGFIQFHRSFIIQTNHIETIDNNIINMTNGITLSVGEYFRKDFIDFLSKKTIKPSHKLDTSTKPSYIKLGGFKKKTA